MIKRVMLLTLPFFSIGCIELTPSPLVLGESIRTNAQNEMTVPLNVTKAFAPTGYFYNVWAPADSTFTKVDPEKWNNFLAYQSIYHHPACRDRVPFDTLKKYDSTLSGFIAPERFYQEFECNQFTYAPLAEDDLYGGVFWLRNDNFGNHDGVKVNGGARTVRFWARSLSPKQFVKFGVGVSNQSTLKPWYYFSPFVDIWGNRNPSTTQLMKTISIRDQATGQMKDTIVGDTVLEGNGTNDNYYVTDKWTLFKLDLGILYAFGTHLDSTRISPDSVEVKEVANDSLPDHKLIGAFFWAMEAAFITDSSNVTDPIRLPDGTTKSVKYGSATILIDGIRYE